MQSMKLLLLLLCVVVAVNTMSVSSMGKVSPRKSGKSAAEKAFKLEVKQLKKMKCKPRLVKVYVADELGETSDYHDKWLFPEVLAVKRCSASYSYCGDNLGRDTKICATTTHKMKNFTIRYLENNNSNNFEYFKLPIKVDSKCDCV
ncbi:hypothetical protein OTU49_007240 [Cherax quadricarinatus]|uniref:Platelet-derived growth factor (PDGF) family profile domain-containing protein n=1 Tax=Cherax quadricarinatus TaxID=27406 RepID=A0AAW0WW19_CHEQU